MTQPQTIYLKDYQAPAFLVDHVQLDFALEPEATRVVSTVQYRKNPASPQNALHLDGHDMELLSIKLDGTPLADSAYTHSDTALILLSPPESFELEITTVINPQANTALEGLYRSSGNYCTQCEAQGFRRITYYQDRPDVMAPFTVTITGDKTTNPVLLSNGNPIASGELEGNRHWAKWQDPFAKPAYLFALVAGDLASIEDSFTTASGRNVTLKIFTEEHHINQCDHAMASLKRAMRWDEERFGLEYDLDLFMIVAVDDFNMGAMENKGLNIFNSRLVFASPETATDDDYMAIEAVIGHEYFHNWTGNRVTCRDWFQLSLKEGLTVFRDQEFTADMHSHAVKRIEDVRMLRTHQFAEDASPMAHPIRPSSYMEINNFYTVTVYEKGAEVVRLYQTLLGVEGFRKGMDLYFQRFDGQAVSTEDFLAAMADANDRDLSQMQLWYDQAGTPELAITMDYDAQAKTCTLHCKQSCPATPEAAEKQPFLIPLTLGLLLPDGSEQPLQLEGESQAMATEQTLLITRAEHSFTFINVSERPLPSLLRGFSAPVELRYDYSLSDDAFLMQHDSDSFNRWAAAQRLAMNVLLEMVEKEQDADPQLITAFASLLNDKELDPALKAEALLLPAESDIAEASHVVRPQRIHAARENLKQQLALQLGESFAANYHQAASASSMEQRKLKNVCLNYLAAIPEQITLAYAQFKAAGNMTDQYAALAVLANCDCPERKEALQSFEQHWLHETNVMDKWFSVQAASSLPGTLEQVKALMSHEKFDLANPNKVRALIGSFAMRNPAAFHCAAGYAFVAEQVIALDKLNPQIASRMVRALMKWKQMEEPLATQMRAELQRIADCKGISGDVYEIVSKSL